MRRKFPLTDDMKALGKIFQSKGYRLYVVGGAVRDHVLGLENDDCDFTTDALPQEVMALFPHHVIPTGLQHGTVTVRFHRQSFEVTTFRSEGEYSDSRHPDSVTFVRSLESDLERRDFTINALCADCTDGHIVDMHDGLGDLKRRIVKAIGDAEERFHEDALRMLRACRFASRLDFNIEEKTFEAMKRNAPSIVKVSSERIREELFKTLMSDHPARGIELMRQCGILHFILPELEECVGVEQKGMHTLDVYNHQLATLQACARHGYPLPVRVACLLHDIGKPACREQKDDGYTFHGHDRAGSQIADGIMARLKCSNAEREKVTLLVREHMFNYTPEWSDGAVRRFINRVGKDNLEDLYRVRIADMEAISDHADPSLLFELEERVEKILEAKEPLSLKDLAIDGNDLIALGVPRGKEIGRILSMLLEKVLEDPSLNTREKLIGLAQS